MATGVIPAGGAENWLGCAFADPANPRTPVGATFYMPVDPDKTKWVYDPKRTLVAAASGTVWANGWVVDEDGTLKFTVAFPLFHNYGQALIFGFLFKDTGGGTTHVGTATVPKYMCFEYHQAGVSTQLAGCLPVKMDIETQSKGVPMVTIEYQGTVLPAEITPSVAPGTAPVYSPAQDLVYAWRDFGSATLLADGAGLQTIDNFKLSVSLNNDDFYGNTGQGLPSDIVATLGEASGEFDKIMKGSTAEMLRFINTGRVPGLLAFGWADGTDSIAITMDNSVYKTGERDSALKKATIEKFKFECLAPAGQIPITYVCSNSQSGAYTTF